MSSSLCSSLCSAVLAIATLASSGEVCLPRMTSWSDYRKSVEFLADETAKGDPNGIMGIMGRDAVGGWERVAAKMYAEHGDVYLGEGFGLRMFAPYTKEYLKDERRIANYYRSRVEAQCMYHFHNPQGWEPLVPGVCKAA